MQSVNLYLPEYRPKRDWLSLKNSAIGFALFVLIMSLLHINQSRSLQQLEERVAQLLQREVVIRAEAESLKKSVVNSDKSGLQKQAQELRAAIANRNAIKDVISISAMGNQVGFSNHLYVLGEKRTQDLVLERFMLSRGGEYLQLEGTTKSPAAVPLYVHSLQQSPAFSQTKFGFLTINDRGGLSQFRLSGNGAMEGDTLQIFSETQFKK